VSWTTEDIARRAAAEIEDGMVVNLGIGMPTLVADRIGDRDVWLHTENGLLGMGPYPVAGTEDAQLINAGKQTVTVKPGGSFFDSVQSFAMIRGRHVDLAIMGALQVSAAGDLANWAGPGRMVGVGGAMDLAAGARRLVVLMTHRTKEGEPKLLARCSYPLTAPKVVSRVITDLGVLDPAGEGFRLVETAPGVDRASVVAATAAPLLG
jgi:3-oxoacid CoA-transferase subunit B